MPLSTSTYGQFVKGTPKMTTLLTFADRVASSAGKASIDKLTQLEINAGVGAVAAVRDMTKTFVFENATDIVQTINKGVAAARSKATNMVVAPEPPVDSRVSEIRRFFKAAEYDCWEQFLTNMEPVKPALSTIVKLTAWFRHKDTKVSKKGGTAPSTDEIIAFQTAARVARKAKPKLEGADLVKANPTASLAEATATLTHLAAIETTPKAKQFLTAALKALGSYQPLVAKRQMEADKVAALAEIEAKYAAGK